MPLSFFPTADAATRARLEADPVIALVNQLDWSATELGPISAWPEALRSAARLVLTSAVPMALLMGPRGIMLYNSPYAPIAGKRHPSVLGQSVLDGWPEVAEFNIGVIGRVIGAGESQSYDNTPFTFYRNGVAEQVYLNLDYTPVIDESGKGLAVLALVQEVTQQVVQQRTIEEGAEKLDLALNASGMVGTWDWDIVTNTVTADDRFARLYGVSPGAAAVGLPIGDFMLGIHPSDRDRVAAEITEGIKHPGPVRFEYRLLKADGEVRWVVASGRVIFAEDGTPQRFPGVVVDITDERRIGEQLAESELRFRTLADTMPQMVWSALPDGQVDYYNARWYEFTGVPEGATDGSQWVDIVHPDDQQRSAETWRHSLETGEPYQIEYRLQHQGGGHRWVLGQALPIRDPEGRIVRWFGSGTDIHEARLAAEEREVVAQELSHRIKNIFAVIGGIVALAARTYPEAKGLATELRSRIIALGKAHDFVRPHSSASSHSQNPNSLRQLVTELMSPYKLPGDDRVEIIGDDAVIDEGAATPLALIFHELGTNAAKYGALANPAGRVEIAIAVGAETCRVTWREIGGAPAPLSDKQGFGSRLVALSVEGQLRGRLTRRWEATGLVAEVELPLASLSRKATLQTA